MPLFSQRNGLKPLKKTLQRDSLDEETRNRIWTALKIHLWDKWNVDFQYYPEAKAIEILLDHYWFTYFKKPIDTRYDMHARNNNDYYNFLRKYFFNCKWNEVFDLIEFALAHLPKNMTEKMCDLINRILTDEASIYRIADQQFIEITSETEIQEVDSATQTKLDGVSIHINTAIKFLSDRKNPDYRNSIKESISAVESLFKILTNNKSATLSEGLKEMKKSVEIHPSLLSGFEKIYAYTSDESGIRHAITDEPSCTFDDAKFMLVSCSAFINYVIGKFAEKQIKIE